jgi:hypothetical protein
LVGTDSASESESKVLFGTYPELINWNLDKQQETNLSDDGITVFQSTMSLLLQMNKSRPRVRARTQAEARFKNSNIEKEKRPGLF